MYFEFCQINIGKCCKWHRWLEKKPFAQPMSNGDTVLTLLVKNARILQAENLLQFEFGKNQIQDQSSDGKVDFAGGYGLRLASKRGIFNGIECLDLNLMQRNEYAQKNVLHFQVEKN